MYHGSLSSIKRRATGPIWLTNSPETAAIYGYVWGVTVSDKLKLLDMNDPRVVSMLSKEWDMYCLAHERVNQRAFPEAFWVRGGEVHRHSEFAKDTSVVVFLQWWVSTQQVTWHGFQAGVLFDDDGISHHDEMMLLDATGLVEIGDMLPREYNRESIQRLLMQRQCAMEKAVAKAANKKRYGGRFTARKALAF